jgi:alanyl-tRNA synthetase
MQGNEIRTLFLRFFQEREHQIVPSSSLIAPVPGLLLTNAGMNQFVPYFLGHAEPPYRRAASAQKCMRTPDIENVGHTTRHLTFFEMLGNFSFGDYFKKEAIRWSHELVTDGYGIDHDRLWVTVFETDDQAAQLWIDEVGVSPERIVRRGKFDEHGEPANFWWTHTAGPCGPCSEIYVDRGPEFGPAGGPDVDEERFLEIWNLVFMQDECDEHSNVIRELPKKNIDTGSSLERVAMIIQGVPTVFDTDLLRPLVEVGERLAGIRYGSDDRSDVSLRVLAEHGRATAFLIADGVLPSNEGRGYVLRRMLRRLVTHARRLGIDKPVMSEFVDRTTELMGAAYPELVQNKAFVHQVATSEEERFGSVIQQGLDVLHNAIVTPSTVEGKTEVLPPKVLPGDIAFKLHDTYGFPIESTIELAAEEGLTVDTDRFAQLMEEQRARARGALKKTGVTEDVLAEVAATSGPTEFLGYQSLDSEARVVGIVVNGSRSEAAGEGRAVEVVLDRTPFYAEGGGQVGDAGTIRTASGLIEVTDTKPGPGGIIVHEGVVSEGEVRQGEDAQAVVNADRREAAARSHTATHVLHHTVRQSLGEHARQAGSLVAPGRLRFDFTHYEALPRSALEEIEYLSNRRLADDSPVRAYETTKDFAQSQGAIALFGEKYGDIVRVVEVGDYSIELCGGTHVRHTGEVGLIRLVSEGSIGSGFRRIEALTGPDALKQVNAERRLLEEVAEAIGAGDPATAPERARHAVARIKELESELGKLRRAEQQDELERLASTAMDVSGIKLVLARMNGRDEGEIRELAGRLANRLAGKGNEPAAVVLGTAGGRGARLVASVTGGLAGRISARQLLEEASKMIGGGVGGKDRLAMAGGPRSDAVDQALAGIPARLQVLLTGA